MAIIRCPECGHEVSDKAPFCPSCGVAIGGKVTICSRCGRAYFLDLKECPYCKSEKHVSISGAEANIVQQKTDQRSDVEHQVMATNASEVHSSKRNNVMIVAASFIIAALLGGVCWFFYHQGNVERENQAYEVALSSTDPQVVQQYLDKYMDDAPDQHIAAMQEHLSHLQQLDADWTNAVVSGSKTALEHYLTQHPDSPFKALALQKIDSIDWQTAVSLNTVEAMENYIEQHADGEHVEEANQKVEDLNSRTVQPEDKLLVSSIFDGFFNALNNKDEDAITSAVNPLLSSFLGKSNATRNDVVTFMHKIYKTDVTSMSWKSLGDINITKNDIGGGKYDFSVTFSAMQNVVHTGGDSSNVKYRISAKVNSDGRITEFNMVKLLDE